MIASATADDVARTDVLLARFEASAGGSQSAMRAAAGAIARAGGSGGPEVVLTEMTQGGRSADDILGGPWRWLCAVAVEATARQNKTLVARIAWFTGFWCEYVLPTMDRAEVFETGLVNAPDELRAEIAALGLAALADLDGDAVLTRDFGGSVLLVDRVTRECAMELTRAHARGVTVDAAALVRGGPELHPSAPSPLSSLAPPDGRSAGRQPQPTIGNSTMDERSAVGDLAALFRKDASKGDRVKAVREFAKMAGERLHGVSSVAGHGTELMAERSAQLLSEVVARLPIRTADALIRDYGAETQTQARHVIDDAAKLAGWLWTAAAAVPAPPAVALAVKVVLHSAIETRMIGELYAIHADALPHRDATWFGTILVAWANGQPVAPGGTVASGAAVLVSKVRKSFTDLIGNDSRFAGIANRGREGSAIVRRLGDRMHRGMRLHPSMWARPAVQSTAKVLGGLAGRELIARVPASALVLAGRSGTAAPEPAAAVATAASPREALARAWALHLRAATAAGEMSPADAVAARMRAALAAQETHLHGLSRVLGQTRPRVSAQPGRPDAALASAYMWEAEDAIDVLQDVSARSRRLPSWSSRGRAALVYLATAIVVSAPVAAALWTSSGVGKIALFAVQSLVLPWLTLAIGAVAIGPLFRPWLGGPVPRHPFVGAIVVVGVHVGVGILIAVLSTLL